ncbi:MAG: AarF/ABC1/UbiB kinase family protein [Balneolaceae bacterium]
MSDFPASKFERGKIFAKTGFQIGSNYAKHYLSYPFNRRSEEDTSSLHTKTAQQVFDEFSKLRGTALKIAQSLSMDQGFLPGEFADVMTQAQYRVPPINRALVRSIIKRELGKYPEQIFKQFESNALAAASIGQVHRATLNDGRKVAVKIQYPGVRDTIESDLAMARSLFKRFVKKGSDINSYFDEIKDTLLEETDYILEGQHIQSFHSRFSAGEIRTPEWIEEFSTRKVLTMTFLEGSHIEDFLKNNPDSSAINHFGQLLWDFFHRQVEENAEIHADTHPGNFLFTPDGKLGVVDFGCVKKFPEDFFMDYLRLLPAHLERDEEKIIRLYQDLDVLKSHPRESEKEKKYFEFCRNYGYTFAMPYESETFDFGNEDYQKLLRAYTREAPVSNEPRGSKHFIYSTRVHLGLYHLLMKLGAQIQTGKSTKIIEKLLTNTSKEVYNS